MGFSESMEGLKSFDVNDLDFNNAGSWPGAIKGIVLFILFAGIVFAGYWFVIKDQYASLEKVEFEEAKLKEQYESKAFRVANLDAFKEQMQEMQKTFGALLKQLPKDTEVPGLLEDITNTGLSTGLTINSIALKPESTKEFYVELPIDISVRGTYHDIAAFVSGVASLPRIVTLHDFTIKGGSGSKGSAADGGNGGEVLTMNIAAKTYRYNPEQQSEKSKKRKKK